MYADMQQMNVDELLKQKVQKFNNTLKKIQSGSAPKPAEITGWKERNFNDSNWSKMMLPAL